MSTVTKTKRKSRRKSSSGGLLQSTRVTWKQFLYQLRKDIFECAFDPDICGFATMEDLAREAGVHVNTARRLYHRDTREPRTSTIFKLCKAIKMDVELVQQEMAKAAPA